MSCKFKSDTLPMILHPIEAHFLARPAHEHELCLRPLEFGWRVFDEFEQVFGHLAL